MIHCDYSGVDPPKAKRKGLTPVRYDANHQNGAHLTAEEESRKEFIDVIDLVITGIDSRFNQKGLSVYRDIEVMLTGEASEKVVVDVCRLYGINVDDMKGQLELLKGDASFQCNNIIDFLALFKNRLSVNRTLFPLVYQLLGLVLVLPATNATSERSFSALKRLKTAMRNSMGQERMNHLILLHVHKAKTDSLDAQKIIAEFVKCHDSRVRNIAVFP